MVSYTGKRLHITIPVKHSCRVYVHIVYRLINLAQMIEHDGLQVYLQQGFLQQSFLQRVNVILQGENAILQQGFLQQGFLQKYILSIRIE